MPALIRQIGALADKDAAEGGVLVVAWPAEHHIVAADLPREQDPIAVIRKKGIRELMKVAEIFGAGGADGRAMVTVAPSDTVAAVDEANPGT